MKTEKGTQIIAKTPIIFSTMKSCPFSNNQEFDLLQSLPKFITISSETVFLDYAIKFNLLQFLLIVSLYYGKNYFIVKIKTRKIKLKLCCNYKFEFDLKIFLSISTIFI